MFVAFNGIGIGKGFSFSEKQLANSHLSG